MLEGYLVPGYNLALTEQLAHIIQNGEIYGLFQSSGNLTTIRDLYDVILTDPEWRWIGENNVINSIKCLKDIIINDKQVIERVRRIEKIDNDSKTFSDSDFLFWPVPTIRDFEQKKTDILQWKVFNDLDSAILVGLHRLSNAFQFKIMKASVKDFRSNGFDLRCFYSNLVLVKPEPLKIGTRIGDIELIQKMDVIQKNRFLSEAIFLEESQKRELSCQFLYEESSQEECERLLVPYVKNKDRFVRMNVCKCLAFPLSSIELIDRSSEYESDWEDCTLSLSTFPSILDFIKVEEDLGVIEQAVDLINLQNYKGKLQILEKQTIQVIQELMNRINDVTIIKKLESLVLRILD